MDKFIQDHDLKRTYAYLDDEIICGQTKEEHDVNLKKFLDAVENANISINQNKSEFST